MKKLLCFVLCFCIYDLSIAQWTNGQSADRVLGQSDLMSSGANFGGIGAGTLNGAAQIAIDFDNNKMYVVDRQNNRVLRYAYPITGNQQAAELVFGQSNFTSNGTGTTQNTFSSPTCIAVDNTGRLWVGEIGNHRVVWFNGANTISSNQPNADGVLGQINFTSGDFSVAQNRMDSPQGLAIDNSGRLWVSDNFNNRILRFDNAASKSNGANADGVLGQSNFTDNFGLTSQSNVFGPRGLSLDADGRLWVADHMNGRILRFDNAAAKSNGANADGVLGKSDFISSGSFSVTQDDTNGPTDVTIDGDGRLYVIEENNHRILIFNSAASKVNGANADNVLGQPNFTGNGVGTTASTLHSTSNSGIAVDPFNHILWAGDDQNSRVIRYSAGSPLPVELVYFKGSRGAAGNRLEWQTASEINNAGFYIQRSQNDMTGWQDIGFIEGNGTTETPQNYTYLDETLPNGMTYYRLKQMDKNTSNFEYSNVITMTSLNGQSVTEISIQPNPVVDNLLIVHPTMTEGIAVIYNASGQPIRYLKVYNSKTTIPIKDLPSGQYFLKLQQVDGEIDVLIFFKY